MFGGDPGRTGYAPEADPPRTEPEIAWSYELYPADGASPIVGNGTVYYQGSDDLLVVDPETGETQEVDTNGWFEGSGPPVYAPSGTYDDGMYIVPYGNLLAGHVADPDSWPRDIEDNGNPRRRWVSRGSQQTNADWDSAVSPGSASAGPVAVDGRIVSEFPGIDRCRLAALDVDTGRARWQRTVGPVFEGIDPSSLRVRTVAVDVETETVVASLERRGQFDGGIAAYDLGDGTPVWGRRMGSPYDGLAASDGTVFATLDTAAATRVVALSVSDGETRWEQYRTTDDKVGISGFGLAVDDRHCYHLGTTEDGDDRDQRRIVAALDRSTGTTVWSRTLPTQTSVGFHSATQYPTVGGEVLFVPGDTQLYAFDRATGERLWTFSYPSGSDTTGRPMTPVVPVGDRLVAAFRRTLCGLEAP